PGRTPLMSVPVPGRGPGSGSGSGPGSGPGAAPGGGSGARGGNPAAWSPRTLLGLLVAELRKMLSTSAWWALLVPAGLIGLLGMVFGGGQLTGGDVGAVIQVSTVALVVFALWAVLGVGLGTLVNNQLAAIVGVLVYLLLVEQIIGGLASLGNLGRIDD